MNSSNLKKNDFANISGELDLLFSEAKQLLGAAKNENDIETARVHFLGKKSKIYDILRSIGSLDSGNKIAVGRAVNNVSKEILSMILENKKRISGLKVEKFLSEKIDITLPGRSFFRGKRHVITQVEDKIKETLEGLGFNRVCGPEIERDFYNFEALNMPKNHPAREMQDTFYIEEEVVLRTHTSPIQVRAMISRDSLPLNVFSIGRVYRRDNDATHSPMFHQAECCSVGSGVSFLDLKRILELFIKKIFSGGVSIRFRPSYFPFTEPSVEIDISCFACLPGKSCCLCRDSGWIEILGAGMIDPNVLESANVNSANYTGFAFGVGLERIAMLKHKISDIRLFFENDLNFLSQF